MMAFFKDENGFNSMMRLIVFIGVAMGLVGFICGLIGFFISLTSSGTIVSVSAALVGAGEAAKYLQKRVEKG